MKRYLMKIAYDGTDYCGWQIQSNGKTVQETIETVLGKIAKAPCPIVGSGRTDSGVHARGQYAHFDFGIDMSEQRIMLAMNSKLPRDVDILSVKEVNGDFHARYDAEERLYRFHLIKTKTPFNARFQSFIPRAVWDEKKIMECAQYLLGEHDFTSFSKLNPNLKHNRSIINKIDFQQNGEEAVFEISANRFLHNMVRRIVGTLVNICITDSDPEIISELILQKDPTLKLITTAPPQGLFLENVIY